MNKYHIVIKRTIDSGIFYVGLTKKDNYYITPERSAAAALPYLRAKDAHRYALNFADEAFATQGMDYVIALEGPLEEATAPTPIDLEATQNAALVSLDKRVTALERSLHTPAPTVGTSASKPSACAAAPLMAFAKTIDKLLGDAFVPAIPGKLPSGTARKSSGARHENVMYQGFQGGMSTSEVAAKLNVKSKDLIAYLLALGLLQRTQPGQLLPTRRLLAQEEKPGQLAHVVEALVDTGHGIIARPQLVWTVVGLKFVRDLLAKFKMTTPEPKKQEPPKVTPVMAAVFPKASPAKERPAMVPFPSKVVKEEQLMLFQFTN